MNVNIDIEPFYYYPSGISIYAMHLVRYINRLNPDVRFLSSYPTIRKNKIEKIRSCIIDNKLNIDLEHHQYPGRLNSLIEPVLNLFSSKRKDELIHGLNFFIPYGKTYSSKLPYLLTFHDIAGYIYKDKKYWAPNIKSHELEKQLSKASGIISVSEFTKKELCKHFNYPADKIFVTHLAPQDTNINISINASKFLYYYGLNKDSYFLSVGAISPRKNFDGLLIAFKKFLQTQKTSAKLVLVGNVGWEAQDLILEIEAMKNNVIWIKELSSYGLEILYKNAIAFFLPSHYEGFGIPVLEAMKNKCPVCYAVESGMDEICKGAGIGVTSTNIEEIYDAFIKYDQDFIIRDENREKGYLKSLSFSWEKCAKETLNVYEYVLR